MRHGEAPHELQRAAGDGGDDHGFQRRIPLRLLAELGVERVLEGADGLHALEVLR